MTERVEWTQADDERLLALRRGNKPWKEIAIALGRLQNSAAARFSLLQQRAAESTEREHRAARVKDRPCMCCGRAFTSEGPHNRMCNSCR